jgi:N-methylhydantoinase B
VSVDVVTLNILGQALTSITEEMGLNLRRAAYSTIIREAMDYSTALLDTDGNLVAQSMRIPIHLLSMAMALSGCFQKHPPATIGPDDILITNDPYAGAQHLPDIFLFKPIYYQEQLIAFTGTTGHHLDVGGGGIGSMNPSATDIYQEGFRIPSVKISVSRDLNGGLFEQIFAANIRDPYQTVGDLYAQLAANRTGEERLLELVQKYGLETVWDGMAEVLNYAERRSREEIAKIPDGAYKGFDYLDSDVFDDVPLRIEVTVYIQGDQTLIDFEGTASQAKGSVNAPFAATVSAAQTAVKSVLTDQTVPSNSGCFRPIEVRAPYGSLLNPKPPAPVRARINTACRAFTAVMRAFSQVIPKRVISSGFETTTSTHFASLRDGQYHLFTEPLRAGYGASDRNDGVDMVSTSMSNCANTPVEAAEITTPFLRFRRYELIQDSGGPGRHRGGFGARREYEILEDGVEFTCFADRHRLRPWGLFGGHEGTTGRLIVRRDDEEIRLQPLDHFELCKSDVLVAETGGGGGYGNPRERDRELVRRDLREERISRKAALEVYGLEED